MSERRDEIAELYHEEPWRRCPVEAKLRDKDIAARMKAEDKAMADEGLAGCPVCGVPYPVGQKSYCGHREKYLEKKPCP